MSGASTKQRAKVGVPDANQAERRGSARRRLFLLMGMHRSGTSLGAQTFFSRGLPMEGALARAPAADNARGYFEDREIVALHDEALCALTGSDDIWSPRLLSSGQLPAQAASRLRVGIFSVLERRFERSIDFGFKDPRSATFLPFWTEAADHAGLEVVPVLFIRTPGAVGMSLRERQGMRPYLGELFWLKNVADTIAGLSFSPAIFPYDRWFTDPHSMIGAIDKVLDGRGESLASDGPSACAGLRHQLARPSTLPFIDEVYARLAEHAPSPPTRATWLDLGRSIDLFVDGMGGWQGAIRRMRALDASSQLAARIIRLVWPVEQLEDKEPGSVSAALDNGNPWCEQKAPNAYQLHPSSPTAPQPTLVWRDIGLAGPVELAGRLELWDNATGSVSVRIVIDGDNGPLAEIAYVLRPGSCRAIDLRTHDHTARVFQISVSTRALDTEGLIAGPLILRDLNLSVITAAQEADEAESAKDCHTR